MTPGTPRRRAPKGTGTLFQTTRPDGSRIWVSREQVELIPGTKKVRVGGEGATPALAQAAMRRNITRRQVNAGVLPQKALLAHSPDVMTVGKWCDKWIATKRELREGTRSQYENHIRTHIKPALGDKPLRLLTAEDIEEFIGTTLPNKRKNNGEPALGPSAIRSCFFVLRSALELAFKRGEITSNPTQTVETPASAKRDKAKDDELRKLKSWAPQQLVKVIEGRDDEARWLLSFFELRQGEALGLTDDKIHWGRSKDKAYFIVDQQIQRRNFKHGCGQDERTGKWTCGKLANQCPEKTGTAEFYLCPTKTGDVRALPLVEPLYSVLKAHQKRQQALRERPEFNPNKGLEHLLFTTPTGKPISPQADRKVWAELLEEAKIPAELRIHDARHLAASLIMSMGTFTEDQMMAVGGWQTMEMLRNTYSHQSINFIRDPLAAYGEKLMEKRSKA